MPLPPIAYKCLMCGGRISVEIENTEEGPLYRISQVIKHEDPMQEDCHILMRVLAGEKIRLVKSMLSRMHQQISQELHGS